MTLDMIQAFFAFPPRRKSLADHDVEAFFFSEEPRQLFVSEAVLAQVEVCSFGTSEKMYSAMA